MTRLLIACAALACALIIAAPAGAVVYVEGTGEPAFTNSQQNTQWMRWQGAPSYEKYQLEWDYFIGTQKQTTATLGVAANGSGVVWANWAGVAPLVEGNTYGICTYGRYWIGGISTRDTGSCFDADQTGRRAFTTIDRTRPQIAVKIDHGAAYNRTAKLNYQIDYSDNLAFPFPANFICRDIGKVGDAACTGPLEYNEACSVPLGGMKKVTYFNCDEDLSGAGIPDGPVTLCVISADGSIPDNPNGANQSASATAANLSARVCDSITIDRVAPQVAIGASATSVLAGDLVNLTVQASDAGSGLGGAYTWTFGDNTPNGAGDTAAHTYTQPGTYQVTVKTADAAGNEASATKVITVNPRPSGSGGGTGGGTGGGGTGTPGGGTGGGTGGAAGGGGSGTPDGSGSGTPPVIIGGLDVVAPKRLQLTGKTKALRLALTAETPGKAAVALVRAGRVHARGAVTITSPGTLGYRLRLPRRLKAGAYRLKVSFTPQGAAKATSRTLKLTIRGAKPAKARKARARAASKGPRVTPVGAPVAVPDGTFRRVPRHVELPVGRD